MKVTFLGTGTSQGVPVIACDCPICVSDNLKDKRLRTSIHLEIDNLSIVVDTGPDFRQQMLRQKIKKLDAVIFTHQHKDHTAGMDDTRSFCFRQKNHIPIYAAEKVITQLQQEFSYVFAKNKYPGVPSIEINYISNKPFFISKTRIIPIQVMHYKLPVFGFRFKDFTYITDANYISDKELEKVKGSKVLVINALQKKSHISHFNLQEAIEVALKVKAEKTYFTHISHYLGFHDQVSRELPQNIELAYDGLKIEL